MSKQRLELGELTRRARKWERSILHQVDGQPTLGAVLDDARDAAEKPWENATRELHEAFMIWAKKPDPLPDDELLLAMSRLFIMAKLAPPGKILPSFEEMMKEVSRLLKDSASP